MASDYAARCPRIGGEPDGRCCKASGCSDGQPDLVDKAYNVDRPMSWCPCSKRTGKQTGHACYYCLQVWRARFKVKGVSLEAWFEQLGSNPARNKEFQAMRQTVISVYIEGGGRDARGL